MIKAGIVGGTGYVAGELIRCLLHHPETSIDFIYSHSQPGISISEVHKDLFTSELKFTDQVNPDADVIFLCLGHGNSKKFLLNHPFSEDTKIIDLSNDFRLQATSSFENKQFIYGLPELNKDVIPKINYIANPGCFATAIQLALLPLANANLLQKDVHIHAITGSTGAGQNLSETSGFSWRNNNLSVYKAFRHQHLDEIEESLNSLQNSFKGHLNLIPMRGGFTRGILATLYTEIDVPEEELVRIYLDFYSHNPFTKVTTSDISLKQVVNTNHCLLQIQKINGKLLITSVIDNLLKGAAGQAVQNMNLMFGLEETTGLGFKANYF